MTRSTDVTKTADPDIAFLISPGRSLTRSDSHLTIFSFDLVVLGPFAFFVAFFKQLAMPALRVAARRLPRASKFVAALESPAQRRFATTSNAPQDLNAQPKVGAIVKA